MNHHPSPNHHDEHDGREAPGHERGGGHEHGISADADRRNLLIAVALLVAFLELREAVRKWQRNDPLYTLSIDPVLAGTCPKLRPQP